MAAYYNENDPRAAAWLRELIKEGLIADGEVDERSICDVEPANLAGFRQCHFFAGIGGWSLALRLAGWDDERAVWTGSCPCQPFSSAGKQLGTRDARHLWPVWSRLIRECRPATVFGEQVANAIGKGWLDAVFTDLENQGYACGAAVLPACSVGAPHKRDRVWFVADSSGARREAWGAVGKRIDEGPVDRSAICFSSASVGGLADADGWKPCNRSIQRGRRHLQREEDSDACIGMADPKAAERGWSGDKAELRRRAAEVGGSSVAECVADAESERSGEGPAIVGRCDSGSREGQGSITINGDACEPWRDLVWLPCRDGKARPTQPGLFPLAHGIPGRVAILRGAGNAIVPQVAAAFIEAYMSVRGD